MSPPKRPSPGQFRSLDANRNRAREALRVLEDYARFELESKDLAAELKTVRHTLSRGLKFLDPEAMLDAREAAADVGRPGHSPVPVAAHSDPQALLAANSSRATEALRSLEESLRLISGEQARVIEGLRYDMYQLEKRLDQARRIATRGDLRAELRSHALCLLLTPSEARPSLEDMTIQALSGGCRFFQIRIKHGSDRDQLIAARAVSDLCLKHGARLVINDRADIAAALPEAGVHLGQDDLPGELARRLLGPTRLLGSSVHNLEELKRSQHSRAFDYFGMGTIFSSQTKPELGQAGPQLLKTLTAETDLAVFAIGGITSENAALAIQAGASGVAVSSSILDSGDIKAACQDMIAAVEAARAQ